MQVFFSLFSVFSKFLSSHPLPRPFCQNRPPFPLFSPGRLGKKLDSTLCSVLHSVQKIFLLEMLQIVHNFRKNLLFLLPALPFSNCFTVRWQKFWGDSSPFWQWTKRGGIPIICMIWVQKLPCQRNRRGDSLALWAFLPKLSREGLASQKKEREDWSTHRNAESPSAHHIACRVVRFFPSTAY